MEGDVGEGAHQAGCPTVPAGPTTVLPTRTPVPGLASSCCYGWGWGVVQAQRAEPTERQNPQNPQNLTQHTQPGQLCMREEEGQRW